MNIWQIQQDLLDVFNELEENGGELTEELESRLTITQEQFKDKIESYTNVIKSINADIAAIDQETKRLADLKKSKKNVVDRLSNVIIQAVNQFGDTTKTGGKFIDYGVGKVSVRNSVKCEVDDDKLQCMGDEYAKYIALGRMLGGASTRENITFQEMINACKNHKNTKTDEVYDEPFIVNKEDIECAAFDITIRAGMEDMLCGQGFNAIKALSSVFGKDVVITPKTDKTYLKNYLNNNEESSLTIGQLVENQTLTIK